MREILTLQARPGQVLMRNSATPALTSVLAMMFFLGILCVPQAQAQIFSVLHDFTGGPDGGQPLAGLTPDGAGNFYGTTAVGGSSQCTVGCGTVFKLSQRNSNWLLTPLYNFTADNDGYYPEARVVRDAHGLLYGTTRNGGYYGGTCTPNGCGTVFKLTPSPTATHSALALWIETVLYRFQGSDGSTNDGSTPGLGDVTFDAAGNVYGTTVYGGAANGGSVFELSSSNGGWSESILNSFTPFSEPWSGVVFGPDGGLYGTTLNGGSGGHGSVYQLTRSGSTWTENDIYSFQGGEDGLNPYAGVIFDQGGNLYGAAYSTSTWFEMSTSGDGWIYSVIYHISGASGGTVESLIMDSAGSLYGTTERDGAYGYGSVFKLTPSGGGWTYTSLHDFCSAGPPCTDGQYPYGGVVFDASGKLYGTTYAGGTEDYGVIFQITP